MTKQIIVTAKPRSIPEIKSEEEHPPVHNDIEEMSKQQVSAFEREAKAYASIHTYILQDKAFVLLIICISILMAVYALDIVLVNLKLENSSLLDGMFDLLKFLASSLAGFVFSQQASKRK